MAKSTKRKVVDLFEALKKSLDGSGPRVGRLVHCDQCGKRKKPIGRDAAPGSDFCTHECPGYDSFPHPDTLWPGEESP